MSERSGSPEAEPGLQLSECASTRDLFRCGCENTICLTIVVAGEELGRLASVGPCRGEGGSAHWLVRQPPP